MSATYNWSYRPNVQNRYNIQIPNTTDDVTPFPYVYVALFGNDSTGNGSRLYPFKTMAGAARGTNTYYGGNQLIIASGVYREIPGASNIYPQNVSIGSLIGDGDVIIDGTQVSTNQIYGNSNSPSVFNIKHRNFVDLTDVFARTYYDWIVENSTQFDGYNGSPLMIRCTWNNVKYVHFSDTSSDSTVGNVVNNTFYKSNVYISAQSNGQTLDLGGKYSMYSNIFSNCNIWFQNESQMDYTIFYNCKFAFGGDKPTDDSPYTLYTSLSDIQNAQIAAFSLTDVGNNFQHCITDDPLFNNPDIGDFTLNYNSPGKNLSYSGSNVGAHSIGYAIKASGTASLTGFDQETSINLIISEDSIVLADTTIDAQIDSVVIPNQIQREISKFPSYGFNADRNGQYIDSIPDMATFSHTPGDILTHPSSYIIENSSIDYNGYSYQPGERFTTATASTTFTSTNGGTIREITEAPERHTIMARFSNGDSTPLVAGQTLNISNWYYVSIGTINYNSFTYSAGDVFKVVSGSPSVTEFTGTGIVTLAMDNSVSYQHYEPGIQPTTNNVGDTRNGDILRGNGDPNYVRGQINVTEFPINARYVQIRYQIKVNNLKP